MESLSDFYRNKAKSVPEDLENGKGHFNVFDLGPYVGKSVNPVPYTVRDYYKIMLVLGKGEVNYADRVYEVDGRALSFSNPNIPYAWKSTGEITGGVFCVFDATFIQNFGNITDYSVFQPKGEHIFALSIPQSEQVQGIFDRMAQELDSRYTHRFDAIRNLILELVHYALKSNLDFGRKRNDVDASQRISGMFMELLERQFPLDDDHYRILLRSPSDFAEQLNVHVNHLNRTIQKTMGRTTSKIILARILRESKTLLRHSDWSIMDIALALGFKEPTHFTNFFKKRTGKSPSQYRKE